jgi:hypothetical protein
MQILKGSVALHLPDEIGPDLAHAETNLGERASRWGFHTGSLLQKPQAAPERLRDGPRCGAGSAGFSLCRDLRSDEFLSTAFGFLTEEANPN